MYYAVYFHKFTSVVEHKLRDEYAVQQLRRRYAEDTQKIRGRYADEYKFSNDEC